MNSGRYIFSIISLLFCLSSFSKGRNKDLVLSYQENLELGISYITGDIKLPISNNENVDITWEGSNENVINNNGKVIRPIVGTGDKDVILTANIMAKGFSIQKNFPVTVAEMDYGYLMSYILSGGTERTNSFFIAASKDGNKYYALNNDKAIVYPLKGTKK